MSTIDENSDITDVVGKYGYYHVLVLTMIIVRGVPSGWNTILIPLMTPPINHWCAPLEGFNQTIWRSYAIPADSTGAISQCNMFPLESVFKHGKFHYPAYGTTQILCKYGHSFEPYILGRTATEAFELVCEFGWQLQLLPLADIVGSMVGSLILGLMSDRHGRKQLLLICSVNAVLFGFLDALSPDFWVFLVGRFLLAAFNSGMLISSIVLFIEIIPGYLRSLISIGYGVAYVLPMPLLGLFAWLLQDFRYLHICVAVSYALILPLFPLLRESPRWLLTSSRTDSAQDAVEDIIRFNRRKLPHMARVMTILEEKQAALSSSSSLSSTPLLTLRLLSFCLIYFTSSLCQSNDLLSSHSVQNNFLWSFILSSTAELFAAILSFYICRLFSRRSCQLIPLSIAAALFLIAAPSQPYNDMYVHLFLGTMVRLLLHASTFTQLLSALEVAPTPVRCSFFGFCIMSYTLGGAASRILQFALKENTAYILHHVIFSCALVVQWVLVWFTPETYNCPLPDTA